MPARPIPEGFHTVTPYLSVRDADALLAFLGAAFGAEVRHCARRPNGRVMNAEVRVGSSMVMVAEAPPEREVLPATLYVYVEDCDAVYAQARAAGASSLMAPETMFYGDRHGGVQDPTGNTWWIATHVEDVPDDEVERRAAAYKG